MLHICSYYNFVLAFFFVKQKTAHEMRISDWSSDVCSSDLRHYRKSEQCEHPPWHHAAEHPETDAVIAHEDEVQNGQDFEARCREREAKGKRLAALIESECRSAAGRAYPAAAHVASRRSALDRKSVV